MVHFPLPGWITYSKQASVFEMWDPNFGDVTCILSITYFQCVPYMHNVFIYIYIHIDLGKIIASGEMECPSGKKTNTLNFCTVCMLPLVFSYLLRQFSHTFPIFVLFFPIMFFILIIFPCVFSLRR